MFQLISSFYLPVVTGDWVALMGPGSIGLLGNWCMFWTSGPLAHSGGHLAKLFIISSLYCKLSGNENTLLTDNHLKQTITWNREIEILEINIEE